MAENMSPKSLIIGYALIDSEARSRSHPDSWAHPDEAALSQIDAGYLVKIGVTHPDSSGERFWGVVKQRNDRTLVIQVDQDLNYSSLHGLADKDILLVGEQNVFGIVDESGLIVWEAK